MCFCRRLCLVNNLRITGLITKNIPGSARTLKAILRPNHFARKHSATLRISYRTVGLTFSHLKVGVCVEVKCNGLPLTIAFRARNAFTL